MRTLRMTLVAGLLTGGFALLAPTAASARCELECEPPPKPGCLAVVFPDGTAAFAPYASLKVTPDVKRGQPVVAFSGEVYVVDLDSQDPEPPIWVGDASLTLKKGTTLTRTHGKALVTWDEEIGQTVETKHRKALFRPGTQFQADDASFVAAFYTALGPVFAVGTEDTVICDEIINSGTEGAEALALVDELS